MYIENYLEQNVTQVDYDMIREGVWIGNPEQGGLIFLPLSLLRLIVHILPPGVLDSAPLPTYNTPPAMGGTRGMDDE